MKRRDFLKAGIAGAAGAALPGSGFAERHQDASDRKPNIVVILADDMGYADTSCYDGWLDTPNLDALAAEGVRFTDFHASCPVCSPTRAGLITGRYQQRAGLPGVVYAHKDREVHYHGLQRQEVTFAEILKRRGYATGIFGKWHLGYLKKYNPLHHGFDEFVGYVSGNIDYISHLDNQETFDWWHGLERVEEEGYVTHLITEHAVDFIRRHRDEPFCLYIPHEAVHTPFQAPGDYPVRGPNKHKKGSDRPVEETYRMMMTEMDKGIGRVMETLKELDIDRKTLVIFFSDNGARNPGSNGPYRGWKGQLWEGGHRVPAIARWPGRIEPGRVCEETTISLDIMPTMLSVAGVSSGDRPEMDGVDLSPLLFAEGSLDERPLFWEYRDQQAMRQGRWKLVRNLRGQKGTGLYDLANDPGEKNDVSGEHPQRVKRMGTALTEWSQEVNADATPQPDKPSSG